jgi:hypothetical protein
VYWSSKQYPELKGLSPLEQRRILAAATSKFSKTLVRRFLVAVGLLLGCAVLDGALLPAYPFSDWRRWVLPIAAGTVFYVYILWEVNGPIYRAVTRYLADRSDGAGRP